MRRVAPWVLLLPLALVGCRSGAPGIELKIGFMGAEASIRIGGGELSAIEPIQPKPIVTVDETLAPTVPPPIDATPPQPETEQPK